MALADHKGLSYVTVKKKELLDSLTKNRDGHRGLFLKAIEGYKAAVIKELESSLESAKAGKEFNKFIQLEEPKDHTKDYNRIIKMLEMSVADEIEISESQFQMYVMDEWSWKDQFVTTSNQYTAGQR